MKPVSSFRSKAWSGSAGFSLVEAIGGLVLFTIMMGALTYGTATLFKFQAQPQVSYNNQSYALAPSFAGFQQAVGLHILLTQAVDQADSVLVLGGTRSQPTLDPNGPSPALAETFADTSLIAAPGSDPFQGYSSWDQRQLNASQFDPYLTSAPDPADFTILTLQGQSHITSITQQRRYTATINGQNDVLYEVIYQPIDWSSGSPVMSPMAFYRTYYAASEDTWSQPPGATHLWYRTDTAWDRDQEGPSRVVFADPYVLAGHDAQAQVTSFSRFVYFLPQLR
jgi:hypothetical protein